MIVQTRLESSGYFIDTDFTLNLPLSKHNQMSLSHGEQAALASVEDLWAEGFLFGDSSSGWYVPLDTLPRLPAHCAYLLGLPLPDSQLTARLTSTGTFAAGTLDLSLEVRHPAIGMFDLGDAQGPILQETGGKTLLMPDTIWQLWSAVSQPPEHPVSNAEHRLFLARCIELAESAKATIDPYLNEINWPVVHDVELTMTEEDGDLLLGARKGEFSEQSLISRAGKALPFPQAKRADGTTVRGITSDKAKPAIETIARNRRLSGQAVPEFLSSPEKFLHEDIDLSDFSKRVRGFTTQVYNSRPYVHISESPRGWLEFSHGRSNANLHDDSRTPDWSNEELERSIKEAKASGEAFAKHGDSWIEVDSGVEDAVQQTVAKLEEAQAKYGRLNARIVLDVIPNVEALEFVTKLPDSFNDMEALVLDRLPQVPPPTSLNAELDAHQTRGFSWLCYLEENSLGGLLADEMGVGKTAQVIALLCRMYEQNQLSPSLIVLPKSLITNWKSELRKFAPAISRVVDYTGPTRTSIVHQLRGCDVVLTSYDTARYDQALLASIDWQVVVADEAQFVKNPTAARTSALKALKAKVPLALTGTPVENGLIEFWCIMDFVRPGLLGSWKDFRNQYERPIANGPEDGREALIAELLEELDPHFLRRLKSEASFDLPEKRLLPPVMVPLSDEQQVLYSQALADAKAGGRGVVLAAITRLLMICAHPHAVSGDDSAAPELNPVSCPKLEATMEILDEVFASREKVLVFTQWKKVQRVLQAAIAQRFGTHAPIVNGDNSDQRDLLIGSFKESSGFAALILNPGVAGYGLNLTEANHIIHYTRPWNPAKEAQATDRAHRRGQASTVYVHYPTVEGTVEETLAKLLEEKSALSHDVMRPSSERAVAPEELASAIGM